MCELIGKTATLKVAYRGYRRVEIIERSGYKWVVEVCGSGLRLEVYEDEFETDE